MPVSAYFGGHGSKVLAGLVKRYGPERGKRIFYALANKEKQTPGYGRHR